jgi:hypothetical protein
MTSAARSSGRHKNVQGYSIFFGLTSCKKTRFTFQPVNSKATSKAAPARGVQRRQAMFLSSDEQIVTKEIRKKVYFQILFPSVALTALCVSLVVA